MLHEASQMILETGGLQTTFWEAMDNTDKGTEDPFKALIPNQNCYCFLRICVYSTDKITKICL